MKKLIATFLTILSCGAASALPLMNPSDASLLCDGLILEGNCCDPCDPQSNWCDAFSVRIGFYGDYVFNRHMKVRDFKAQVEDTELYTNAGLIAANFYDRVDLFATLGATSMFINSNSNVFTPLEGGRAKIEGNSAFSWSLGARGTIWECGCTSLGAEFQYFRTRPHITRFTLADSLSVYPTRNTGFKYQEWQVGAGISHRINIFVPYIGIKWSNARLDMGDATFLTGGFPTRLRDLKLNKHFGYAVGVSLIDCEKASLAVEGRFGDEKALHVNGQIRF